MHRRAFITSCLAAPAASVAVAAQPAPTNTRNRVLSALNAARRLEISGQVDKLRGTFHSDAIRVTPGARGRRVSAELCRSVRGLEWLGRSTAGGTKVHDFLRSGPQRSGPHVHRPEYAFTSTPTSAT